MHWWEKILVKIIAQNFRVMFYIQSNRLPHQTSVQRKLVLMGYPEDVELAYEVFHLAAEAMRHFASLTVQTNKADKLSNATLRKSYYQGFLDGLDSKFKAQREAMAKENEKYALIVQTPQEVRDKFNEEIKGSLAFKQPELLINNQAYYEGYDKGQAMDFQTKKLKEK